MKKKTKVLITASIVIILLAGASVYSVWLQSRQEPKVLGETTKVTQQKAVNNQYGFSYTYPSNLYVDQETSATTWLYSPAPFDFVNSPKTTDGSAKSGIQIQVYENAKNLALSDWLKTQTKFPAFTTTQLTLSSGVDAFLAETSSNDWNARSTYFVKLQSAILQVAFYANNNDLATKDLPIFEGILNSLQVNAESASVSSETYQNGTVGFLVDYPSNFKLSDEDYDSGKISFTSDNKKLQVDVNFGGESSSAKDLAAYFAKQSEKDQLSKPMVTKVGTFSALVATLKNDINNSYYYVSTSVGYFTLHVTRAQDLSAELKVTGSSIINSLRVYELTNTKDWQSYTSSDGMISFLYPADASIENLSNGVQIQQGSVKFSVYQYQNLSLALLDWVDSAQLNKYKGSDSQHFALKVKSKVDGKEALRTVDPVSNLKLTTYVATPQTMYIVELNPFDVKDAKDLATYNTIVNSLKLK